jgi:hypothetical protein
MPHQVHRPHPPVWEVDQVFELPFDANAIVHKDNSVLSVH